MGRESQCQCTWNGSLTQSKALLESSELILRGDIRRLIPFSEIRDVHGAECDLSFYVDGILVNLRFPTAIAAAWAKSMSSPPVPLATKLGIHEGTPVLFQGHPSSLELRAALGIASIASWNGCEIAVAEVTMADSLNEVLRSAATSLRQGVSLWIVYPKGRGHSVNERLIRETARQLGWRDNKVASISAHWTGLRFARAATW